MRCWFGWRRMVGGVSAGLALGACSGSDVAPASAPSDAVDAALLGEVFSSVGEACPAMQRAAASAPGRDEIFVEAALVDVPSALAEQASLNDLPELARSRSARLISAPHVIGTFETSTAMAPGQNADALTPIALSRWSVRPRHVDAETSTLELELELSALGQPQKTLRFSVTTRDNEPGLSHVVRDVAAQRSVVVVFRSFRVHGESELRAIFECKMQQRARYLQRLSRPATR